MGGRRRRAALGAMVLMAGLAAPATTEAEPGQTGSPRGEPPRITVRELTGPVEWPFNPLAFSGRVTERISERGHVLLPTTVDADTVATAVWRRGRIEVVPNPPEAFLPLTGLDVSNRGDVVGVYTAAMGCRFAPVGAGFLCPVPVWWTDGELRRLPSPSGFGLALDVNDRGQVTGRLVAPPDSPPEMWQRAVVWDDGELVTPPGPHPVEIEAGVDDHINNRGQVLVEWQDDGEHVGVWQVGAGLTEIDGGGQETDLLDINDRGDVVGITGEQVGSAWVGRAVLWRDGQVLDLGDFGGGSIRALTLDERGQVLVAADQPDGRHAYVWDDGELTDLGLLPDGITPSDMNDRGQILGTRYDSGLGERRPVLGQGGHWVELPRPEGLEGEVVATDFDSRGHIVGHVGTTSVMWTVHPR